MPSNRGRGGGNRGGRGRKKKQLDFVVEDTPLDSGATEDTGEGSDTSSQVIQPSQSKSKPAVPLKKRKAVVQSEGSG